MTHQLKGTTMRDGTIVISTPEGIELFQLIRLNTALKLEMMGLKHSQGSVYAHIKRTYNFKGNKQTVLNQLTDFISHKDKEFKEKYH